MSLKISHIIMPVVITFLLFSKKGNCQDVKIDHVICVVNDLESSIRFYEKSGFTIKKGRQHNNRLLNAHIKFSNGSSYELMTVKGNPGNGIAKNYQELLKTGDGGVFVALAGIKTEEMEQKLSNENIPHKVIKLQNWNYITFSETSSLAHFFFIEYKIKLNDKTKTLTHTNHSSKIKEVYIDGDEKVRAFLKAVGLKLTETVNDSKFGPLTSFRTEAGNILLIPTKKTNQRPRIKAITFGRKDDFKTFRIDY